MVSLTDVVFVKIDIIRIVEILNTFFKIVLDAFDNGNLYVSKGINVK